jgi:hypothetical protein
MNRQAEKSPPDHSTRSGSMAMTLGPELGVNDILLGRGTGPNENQGNVRFRKLLEDMVEKLQDPKRSSMILKTKFATGVLQTIKERN